MGILGSLINSGLGKLGLPFRIGGGGGGGSFGGGGIPQANVIPITPQSQLQQMHRQQEFQQTQQNQLLASMQNMLQQRQPFNPQEDIQNVFRQRYSQ